LTDTLSQALRYLRLRGVIARNEEHAAEFAQAAALPEKLPALYG
jgi:hypothetical protein